MQGCLGIYVQKNLIKYAKVSKDRSNLKIEAYGVKFYDGDIEKSVSPSRLVLVISKQNLSP